MGGGLSAHPERRESLLDLLEMFCLQAWFAPLQKGTHLFAGMSMFRAVLRLPAHHHHSAQGELTIDGPGGALPAGRLGGWVFLIPSVHPASQQSQGWAGRSEEACPVTLLLLRTYCN